MMLNATIRPAVMPLHWAMPTFSNMAVNLEGSGYETRRRALGVFDFLTKMGPQTPKSDGSK